MVLTTVVAAPAVVAPVVLASVIAVPVVVAPFVLVSVVVVPVVGTLAVVAPIERENNYIYLLITISS